MRGSLITKRFNNNKHIPHSVTLHAGYGQDLCPRIRDGKNNSARKNANTASNAIPRSRNGIEINQTIGHNTKASNANGQQTTHNNNQQINVNISTPPCTHWIF